MKKMFTRFIIAACIGLTSLAAINSLTVYAGSFTNFAENKLVDTLFRAQASGVPAAWYVGLDTVACGETGSGTEVTGGSYARVAVTSSLANWSETSSTTGTGVSSGVNGTTTNIAVITFPAPTANWGTVASVRVWDASTSGNAWMCFNLTTSKTINNGDAAPSFAAGSLTVQVDN